MQLRKTQLLIVFLFIIGAALPVGAQDHPFDEGFPVSFGGADPENPDTNTTPDGSYEIVDTGVPVAAPDEGESGGNGLSYGLCAIESVRGALVDPSEYVRLVVVSGQFRMRVRRRIGHSLSMSVTCVPTWAFEAGEDPGTWGTIYLPNQTATDPGNSAQATEAFDTLPAGQVFCAWAGVEGRFHYDRSSVAGGTAFRSATASGAFHQQSEFEELWMRNDVSGLLFAQNYGLTGGDMITSGMCFYANDSSLNFDPRAAGCQSPSGDCYWQTEETPIHLSESFCFLGGAATVGTQHEGFEVPTNDGAPAFAGVFVNSGTELYESRSNVVRSFSSTFEQTSVPLSMTCVEYSN